jgi:hypothetical protein
MPMAVVSAHYPPLRLRAGHAFLVTVAQTLTGALPPLDAEGFLDLAVWGANSRA